MKKLFQLILLIGVFIVTAIFLSACATTPNDTMVKDDIQSEISKSLKESETVDSIEIVEHNTSQDKKTDTVYCEVNSNNGDIAYTKYYVVTYQLSDESQWILKDISADDSTKNIQTPLKGISEKNIRSSLTGRSIIANGESWEITSNSIAKFSIDKQETNLEENKDSIAITLTLDSDVEEASGKLEISYIFDDGWKIDSMTGNEEFTAVAKPDVALEVTNADLIAEIAKQEFKFGALETDMGNGYSLVDKSSQQTITMNESELSNFVINEQTSSSKGTQQKYDCSCTLTKANAVFNLNVVIQYYYLGSNGWQIQPVIMDSELVSMNILGDWNGTYNGAGDKGDVTLNITEVTDDGSVTAVYSYTPSSIDRYRQPGSYNVSGKIDKSTLFMKLTAGDWIVQPPQNPQIAKQDIVAILYVNDSKIDGLGQHGNSFMVQR